MLKEMKYSPLLKRKLAKLIAGDETPNRRSGRELVEFFNEVGFEDDYVYPNVGIKTADLGDGLSRNEYTKKRLSLMTDEQIDLVVGNYLDSAEDKEHAQEAINNLLGNAPSVEKPQSFNRTSFQPQSQFNIIPEGVPVVFISYSWDDEEHKKWVKKLSDDLRTKYDIYTLLDQYNFGGQDIVEFINRGLAKADRVLMIGTPTYKSRAEGGVGTGSKYEGSIINAVLYRNTDTLKFIPLLRRGNGYSDSFIDIISTRNGYDFRDDSKYEERLKEVADDIFGRNTKAPALGGNK